MTIREQLEHLLRECVRLNASDVHLSPGLAPHFRHQGGLAPHSSLPPLTAEDIWVMATELLTGTRLAGQPAATLDEAFGTRGAVDGAITSADGIRYRYNIFRSQNHASIAIRRLEDRFRTLAELGLPESLYDLCNYRDGLVVISGPTGSGKSTTIGTLIDRINQTRDGHIITIEDPIEYLHKHARSVVHQRQVGLDAPGFNEALVDSLRQDPDVILVGEIRDLDTIRTAIIAAETGHLVFTTLHAGDCVGAVERLVSVFPSDEQDSIRRQLSLTLRAVVAQRLLQRLNPTTEELASGLPCVVASEILLVTAAVANLIAIGRSAQIYSTIETGLSHGMRTLEQDLAHLCMTGQISEAAALAMARSPSTVKERIANLQRLAENGNGNANGRSSRRTRL